MIDKINLTSAFSGLDPLRQADQMQMNFQNSLNTAMPKNLVTQVQTDVAAAKPPAVNAVNGDFYRRLYDSANSLNYGLNNKTRIKLDSPYLQAAADLQETFMKHAYRFTTVNLFVYSLKDSANKLTQA